MSQDGVAGAAFTQREGYAVRQQKRHAQSHYKEILFRSKASEFPPNVIILAAMAGPMNCATCALRLRSDLAASSSSAGTRSATMAV